MKFKQAFLETFQENSLKYQKATKIYLKHLKNVLYIFKVSNYKALNKSIVNFELNMNEVNLKSLRLEIKKAELL